MKRGSGRAIGMLILLIAAREAVPQDRGKETIRTVDTAHITISVLGQQDDETTRIRGAKVTVMVPAIDFEKSARTKRNGKAKIKRVPMGDVVVRVMAKSWESDVTNVRLEADNQTFAITLGKLQPPLPPPDEADDIVGSGETGKPKNDKENFDDR